MKKLAALIQIILFIPSLAIAGSDTFSSIKTKLRYLNKRQAVISKNIANANTPGYKALDLEDVDFNAANKKSSRIRLNTTSPGHLGATPNNVSFKKIQIKDSYDTSPDGNNVILEEQMIKMAETDMDYRATLAIIRQVGGLFKTAIGDK